MRKCDWRRAAKRLLTDGVGRIINVASEVLKCLRQPLRSIIDASMARRRSSDAGVA